MLIVSIVIPFVVIACYALGFYLLKTWSEGDYEIKTKPAKSFAWICLFLGFIGLGFSVLAIVLIASNGSNGEYMPLIIIGGLIGLFGALIFLFAIIQFEAIKGGMIYYRRFIKIKTMRIRDVKTIEPNILGFIIRAKDGSKFSVSVGTEGLDLLVQTITDRMDPEYYSEFAEPESVPGSQKNYKKTFFTLIGIAVSCLFIGGISSIGCFTEPIKEENLAVVTGEFEYIRNSGRGNYSIGLKNRGTEYRISSIIAGRFDKSFFDEVKEGDLIVLRTENDIRDMTSEYKSRSRFDYVCAIEANSKEYLTYDGYVAGFEKNRNWARGLFISGASGFVISSIATLATFIVYKREEAKEIR
ncbi:MAG: hypothetical protein II158_05710 [Bacilli bacterium]|nr:hypothetical protein [Bacilli bacterium]